jgi:hypothetical protein
MPIDAELQSEVEEGLSAIGRDLRDYIDKQFAERIGSAETAAFGDSGSLERASVRGAIFGAVVLALGVWLGRRS